MGFVVGEVLAMGILFKITESMSHNAAFLVVAVVGVGVASVFLFIVKEPQLRKSSPGQAEDQNTAATDEQAEEQQSAELSEEAFK